MTDGPGGSGRRAVSPVTPTSQTPSTMQDRRPSSSALPSSASPLVVGAALAFSLAVAIGAVLGLVAVNTVAPRAVTAGASQAPIAWPPATPDPLKRNTAVTPIAPAPPIQLTDQDGRPFDLASLRGSQVIVIFGYTHCPDVCPTTLADLRDALSASPTKFKVVFVTIDPERDDAAAMTQYVNYYQSGFIGLTGTAAQIRTVADAWGIQYAKIDSASGEGYSMAHTADAFLLDAAGRLRHRIWFGAGAAVFDDRVAQLAAEPMPSFVAVTPAPAATLPMPSGGPSPTASSGVGVVPDLVTSVIRVGTNRLVVRTSDSMNRELALPGTAAHVTFRDTTDPAQPQIDVDAYQIWVSVGVKGAWVADVTFPVTGEWTGTMSLSKDGAAIGSADFEFAVKERGTTPAVGDLAPVVKTPTVADANGNYGNITTDVYPDPRFYAESVDQLLAEHKPFVLTFYSPAYCPTTACGPLLKNLKKIASEFPTMSFVHVEPHVMLNYGDRLVPDYTSGQLTFNDAAKAYGLPVEPFVFVVDANGRVAASFELIVGTDEIRAAIRAALGQGG